MSWRISLISFSSRWSANMADAYVLVFKPGPSLIGALKKDWASPSSIALSWQQPEQSTLPILEYEIKYYEKVKWVLSPELVLLNQITGFCLLQQEHEQLSYSSTRTKAPSVIISGLKPATWYIFCVRTRTAAGYSSYSPKYEYETTGDCEWRPKNSPVSISVCIRWPPVFA